MDRHEDYELVQAWIKGDEAAGEILVSRTRSWLWYVAKLGLRKDLTATKDTVNDIVQDVYCKAFEKAPGYDGYGKDGQASFASFLNGILYKRLANWYKKLMTEGLILAEGKLDDETYEERGRRQKAKIRTVLLDTLEIEQPQMNQPQFPDPESAFIWKETCIKIRKIVISLHEAHREVLRFHYFNDISLKDIAILRGIKYDTVRKHHVRGIAAFKKKFLSINKKEKFF